MNKQILTVCINMCLLVMITLSFGCIEAEQILTLAKDGSGTYELSYTIPEQTITQMKGVAQLERDISIAASNEKHRENSYDYTQLVLDPSENKIRSAIAKYAEFGLSIEQLRIQVKNAQHEVLLKVNFNDIAKLAETDFFAVHGFSLQKDQNGRYILSRPGIGNQFQPKELTPETIRTLTPILRGFKILTRIYTPGAIIRANSHRVGRYSATWNFDFDIDPNAMLNFQKQTIRILFDGKDISLPEIKGPSS
ncbi:MAG: hypothetical protein JXN60_09580 [Lentisphaerae bacterium]|nr:hypothetical protein [Lentisphaerota bacterium]